MRWGLERCRRQGGVINVVIRVLFNVYVLTRRKRACVLVLGGLGNLAAHGRYPLGYFR